MTRRVVGLFTMVVLMAGPAFAQQAAAPAPQSHKGRTILSIAGAGGGFAAGVFLGLHWFDDAINSDRKVWTTAIIGAGAGGLGGYLLGRSVDRPSNAGLKIPVGGKDLMVAPSGNGIQVSMTF